MDTHTTPEDIPPAAVALIDHYLANLGERTLVSVAEVRDVLLDVRNTLWNPPAVTASERVALEALELSD